MEAFSPEWRDLLKRGCCPNGDKGPFGFKEGTGPPAQLKRGERALNSKSFLIGMLALPTSWGILATPVGRAVFRMPKATTFREDSSFSCSQCNGNWKVFYRNNGANHVVILGLTNARRSSVSMGSDNYIRDNRLGTESMIATVKVSRRWLQKVEILWEEAKANSTTGRLKLSSKYAGTEVEQQIQRSLKSSLSLSSETEQALEQTLQIPIPAHSQVTIRLKWKQIWQEGQINAELSDGTSAQIPYRAAVDFGFDQENIPE